MKKIIAVAAMVPVFAVLLASTGSSSVSAQKAESTKAPENYSYVAQSGDSFTVLARKAVQTFGVNEKVNLSLAQILFAESNLAVAAGQPELNVGQAVKITKADVKSWVEKAKKLNEADKAAWATYVPFVATWDTRSNGQ